MTELKLSKKRDLGETISPRLSEKPEAHATGWSPSAWRGRSVDTGPTLGSAPAKRSDEE